MRDFNISPGTSPIIFINGVGFETSLTHSKVFFFFVVVLLVPNPEGHNQCQGSSKRNRIKPTRKKKIKKSTKIKQRERIKKDGETTSVGTRNRLC